MLYRLGSHSELFKRNTYKLEVVGIKNMELRLLRYFLTVAKEQSFTKAAEQLHITQPTLSRQMAAFEEELGVILFIRSGKKISLTEEGVLLKRRALEILNLEEKTLEELKGKEDLIGKPLILPERVNVQSELANWFGKDFSKLQLVSATLMKASGSQVEVHLFLWYIERGASESNTVKYGAQSIFYPVLLFIKTYR